MKNLTPEERYERVVEYFELKGDDQNLRSFMDECLRMNITQTSLDSILVRYEALQIKKE